MILLVNFDTTENFWEVNEHTKTIFKDLYRRDKSKNKQKTSDLMWYFSFLHHPDSPYREQHPDERLELSKESYPNLKPENYEEEEQLYIKYVQTEKSRLLDNWKKKLRERDDFIQKTPYIADNVDLLEKMLEKYHKMWETYHKIEEEVLKERNEAVQGGLTESLSDLDLI